jgi:uncharacterized protein involved in outer membrane biogenesis
MLRDKPWLRRTLIGLAVFFGVVVVLIGAAVGGIAYLVNSGRGLEEATARISGLLGRQVTIADADVDWGRVTHVRLVDVVVDNVEWAKDDHFLETKLVEFDLRLWPILWGNFDLPKLKIDEPKVFLERNAAGETNWSFGAQPAVNVGADVVAPENREEVPALNDIEITDGTLKYTDPGRKLALDGLLSFGTGAAAGQQSITFKGKGELEGRPLDVTFEGGPFNMLRHSEQPYPLHLKISYGATKVEVKGTAKDPVALEGTDLELHLSGPDLADVFPVLGVPAPPTPPYKLAGQLLRDGDVWRFENFSGVIGDSDMVGSLAIDYGPERPILTAKLKSKLLDFDDLGPLVGVPPKTEGGESASQEQEQVAEQLDKSDSIFPDLPLNVDKLKIMDMDVALDAAKVRSEKFIQVTALSFHVKVKNGKATVEPLQIAMAKGSIAGKLMVDSNPKPAEVGADLTLKNIELAQFFQDTKYFDATSGKLDGKVKLTGQGRSLADVMGTADGDVRVIMDGGSISYLAVELAGLDIGQALIIYIEGDDKIPIRCTAGKITFVDGRAGFSPFIMDTTDSVLYFRGGADLKAQTFDMLVEADAKDFSLLDVNAPVAVQGKIGKPKISIGPIEGFPLIEAGDAENIACGKLIQTVLSGS